MKLLFSSNKQFRIVNPPSDMPITGGYLRELTEEEETLFSAGLSEGSRWIDTDDGLSSEVTLVVAPVELPAWRVKAICDALGHTANIEAAIDTIADPVAKAVALRAWHEGNTLSRVSPLILSMAVGIGLTEDDLKAIWSQAEAIVA